MKALLPILRNVQNELAAIPSLNYGGCGAVAFIVGQRLRKLGIEVKVRLSDYSADSMDDCRPNRVEHARENDARSLPDWHEENIYFGHVVLEFMYRGRAYQFDSEYLGPVQKHDPTFRMPFMKDSLTLKELGHAARSKAGWNRCFDRQWIPFILRKVSKSFA